MMPIDELSAHFSCDGVLYRRNVSGHLCEAVLDIPLPPPAVVADWQRDITQQLRLEAGDIDTLPLGRTRLRWPEHRQCFNVLRHWMENLGLPDLLGSCEVALMASRGTRYHHDGMNYGSKIFCNLFLSDDTGVDFDLPLSGRLALKRGTVVIFDPCQPHALIRRGAAGFEETDFLPAQIPPQVFLTWELPAQHGAIQRLMNITIHPCPDALQTLGDEVRRNQERVCLCPKTGAWLD